MDEDEQTKIEEYNYRDLNSSDFLPFRTHLPVGFSAPGPGQRWSRTTSARWSLGKGRVPFPSV